MTPRPLFRLQCGDNLDLLRALRGDSVDAIVCDPPYGLRFMGKKWDYELPPAETWRECLRVLRPGGHLVAFGGTRTYHRMAVAIEDAGFEIRDEISVYLDAEPELAAFMATLDPLQREAFARLLDGQARPTILTWLYGQGFPKSHDVSKAIDALRGAEREVVGHRKKTESYGAVSAVYGGGTDHGGTMALTAPATEDAKRWEGWGTALKPAHEPIVLARKPLVFSVAENVLAHGTGALNVDGCRIPTSDDLGGGAYAEVGGRDVSPALHGGSGMNVPGKTAQGPFAQPEGRWPANVAMGEAAGAALDAQSGERSSGANPSRRGSPKFRTTYGEFEGQEACVPVRGVDAGGASRFFCCPKASEAERGPGNDHPTVKPVALMRWLVRLVAPPGALVLDPWTGSGSTGVAVMEENAERDADYSFLGMDRDPHFLDVARRRIALAAFGERD